MHSKITIAVVAALAAIAQGHKYKHQEAVHPGPIAAHPGKGSSPYAHREQHGREIPAPAGTGNSEVPTTTVPLSTGTGVSNPSSGLPTGDHVLTYTLGSGTSTQVVTTTIHQTTTTDVTIYKPFPTDVEGETPGQPGSSPEESPVGGKPAGESPAGESPFGEKPSGQKGPGESPSGQSPSGESPSGESPSKGSPSGQGESGKPGSPSGEKPTGSSPGEKGPNGAPNAERPSTCPPQVTVTVAGPEVTVTVTATPSGENAGKPGSPGREGSTEGPGSEGSNGNEGSPAGPGSQGGKDNEGKPGSPGSPEGSNPSESGPVHGPIKPGQGPHTVYSHTTIIMTSYIPQPSGTGSPKPTGGYHHFKA